MNVPATERLRAGDIELAYVERGAGDPPLVLVHGYTGSSLDWVDVVDDLAADRRVLAYDQRGHGDSTNTSDPASYAFDLLTADLASFVDALAPGPLDLLGHSMGGAVALRYTLSHPDRVRSLVLMDTSSRPAAQMPLELISGVAETGRTKGMTAVAEMFAAMAANLDDGTTIRASAEQRAVAIERTKHKLATMDPEAFDALGHELGCYESMYERLGELTCPVLVMVGEHDTGLRAAADEMAAAIPGAVLAVIAEAAHSPQQEHRDAWLDAMRTHLARSSGDPGR